MVEGEKKGAGRVQSLTRQADASRSQDHVGRAAARHNTRGGPRPSILFITTASPSAPRETAAITTRVWRPALRLALLGFHPDRYLSIGRPAGPLRFYFPSRRADGASSSSRRQPRTHASQVATGPPLLLSAPQNFELDLVPSLVQHRRPDLAVRRAVQADFRAGAASSSADILGASAMVWVSAFALGSTASPCPRASTQQSANEVMIARDHTSRSGARSRACNSAIVRTQ
ncbi:hypothetical protein V8E36_009044 [Tilletia maclaganii]